jgi:hypothetical protein
MQVGGRWNAPGDSPALYLLGSMSLARSIVRLFLTQRLRGQPFGAEDLEPSELPLLITVDLPLSMVLDVVSDNECEALGLPITYPLDANCDVLLWSRCQLIGQQAREAGIAGIVSHSVAASMEKERHEELAWFPGLGVSLQSKESQPFEEWFGPFDW